jgi:transcriptional regulator
MYLPTQFKEESVPAMHAAIRAARIGTLVTMGEDGMEASHVPMLVDPEPAPYGTLRGHVSKGNPQWRRTKADVPALAMFLGPNAYITPAWYETKRQTGKVVPTWNYATVHVWGRPRVVNDNAWLRRQLDDLTASREKSRDAPWAVDDAPADFVAMQMRAIVGVEILISRIEGKWKMSQNRPEADRAGVIEGFRSTGEAGAEIAALVAERGASLK